MSRPLIAILRGITPDEAVPVTAALLDAGFERIEVPMNSPEPVESIRRIAYAHGDRGIFGAGTVLSVEEVEEVKQAGGTLIVSPNCDGQVIMATVAGGLESWPGVFTPTEAFAALGYGATGLKLFPGDMAGANGLKAMKAVLPGDVPVYAVGGAGPENFGDWIAAGADGFGIGSALYKAGMGVDEISKNAERIIAAYDKAAG